MRIGPRCRCQTPDPACGVCRVMHTHTPTSYAWGGFVVLRIAEWEAESGRNPVGIRSAPRRPLPCVHEGSVIEPCKSCGNKEGRHIRQCFEPSGTRDRCSREFVGPAVQACSTCPDYAN